MTTQVDFSSVFDIVLPNVYVKKISLLPSSLVDRTSANYHDEEIVYNYGKNVFGKTTIENKPIDFEQVVPGEKYLMVRAELVIKDYVQGDGTSYWVENDELLNFLKLRVLLSGDEETTEKLRNRGLTPQRLKLAKNKGKIQEQIISLSKSGTSSIDSLRQETIDGRKVYCASYSVSFKLTRLRPKHLAIFANTIVDLNAYALTKPKYAHSRRGHLQGNIAAQLILRDGNTVDESTMFVLPNGKVWAGPVHEHDGVYMAGAFHTPVKHPKLKEKKVPNVVVEDYRLLSQAARAPVMLRPKRIKLPRGKRHVPLKVKVKQAYISEPEYSSNGSNELFMTFHVNFEKLLKEKTQFGALVENTDRKARKRILELSAIKSISIYRNRVLRGLTRADHKLAEYDDRTEMVAHSAETIPGKVKTRRNIRQKTPNIVDSEKVLVGSIREVDLGFFEKLGIRSFAVSDFEMAKKTDGEFNYTVELEITDGTQKFVEEELHKLAFAQNLLTEYLSTASIEGHTDIMSGGFSQMFIDKMQNTYSMPQQDEVLGASRAERLQTARRSVAELPWNRAVAAYIDVLGNLADFSPVDSVNLSNILYSFVNPSTGSSEGVGIVLMLVKELENKITKHLGNKSLSVSEMDFKTRTTAYKGKMPKDIFSCKKTFRKLHDSNVLNNVGYDFLGTLAPHRNAGHRAVTTEQIRDRFSKEHSKYFGGPADETLERNYYSYLSPALVELGESYRLRLIEREDDLWRPRQYNAFLANRLAMNPRANASSRRLAKSSPREAEHNLSPFVDYGSDYDKHSSKMSKESYGVTSANSHVLSLAGISIMTPDTFAKQQRAAALSEGEGENDGSVDPREVLGDNTSFATDPVDKEELDQEPQPDEKKIDLSEVGSVFVGTMVAADEGLSSKNERPPIHRVEEFVNFRHDKRKDPQKARQRFFNKMPNQVRSIFLSDKGSTTIDWMQLERDTNNDLLRSTFYSGLLYLNFQHINRVETLVGFDKDKTGEAQVSSPIYRILNKNRLDSVTEEGRPLLCRMASYENKLLHFKKSKKLTMPEYDSSFFIIPERSVPVTSQAEPEDAETLVVSRLTELSNLNRIGRVSLQRETRKQLRIDEVPAEFQTTLPVFQPNVVNRVGTRFAAQVEDERTPMPSVTTRTTASPNAMPSVTTRTTASPGSDSGGGY